MPLSLELHFSDKVKEICDSESDQWASIDWYFAFVSWVTFSDKVKDFVSQDLITEAQLTEILPLSIDLQIDLHKGIYKSKPDHRDTINTNFTIINQFIFFPMAYHRSGKDEMYRMPIDCIPSNIMAIYLYTGYIL